MELLRRAADAKGVGLDTVPLDNAEATRSPPPPPQTGSDQGDCSVDAWSQSAEAKVSSTC